MTILYNNRLGCFVRKNPEAAINQLFMAMTAAMQQSYPGREMGLLDDL